MKCSLDRQHQLGDIIEHGTQAEIFKSKYGLDDIVAKRSLDSTHKNTRQEVEIIKHLKQKHIVQFYYVRQDMVVMEFVEGGSLADAIVGRELKSWEVKAPIAKDISLGLAYLHGQGMIYCDIKSPNILLTEHKEARICDFGLTTRTGVSGGGGTLQRMAPELLRDPRLHTSKSDVYALSMIMWVMASESTRPYLWHTPDGMMYCILNCILGEYPADTPKPYAACIQMCWMQEPDQRPDAVDIFPDIEQTLPQQGEIQQQQQQRNRAGPRDEKTYNLKALSQYFKTSSSRLKDNDMLGGKYKQWIGLTSLLVVMNLRRPCSRSAACTILALVSCKITRKPWSGTERRMRPE